MADNCPGGVCVAGAGGASGTYYGTGTYTDEEIYGSETYPAGIAYGGQWTLGDQYKLNRLNCQQMQEMKLMYENMLRQFGGPEGTWIRMLIKDRMRMLMSSESDYRQASRGITPPAIPDWMEEYILPQQEQQGGGRQVWTNRRGGRKEEPFKESPKVLRPLGAQEDLTPEQMQWMSGWQAWQKAGAPTEYSQEALMRMSDIERAWTPYQMESQSLFPSQNKLRPKWATAFQR